MRRRLFLTGPMGCGKSTAIDRALSEALPRCGGFRTRRETGPEGHALRFFLESPDGHFRETFLEIASGKPEVNMAVFSGPAIAMLKGSCLVLDEIGGVELLCPEFMAALETTLESGVPILGVMKGEGPAGALVKALGLTGEYEAAALRLRQWMTQDENTLLYPCGQFDETALSLALLWAKEYANA